MHNSFCSPRDRKLAVLATATALSWSLPEAGFGAAPESDSRSCAYPAELRLKAAKALLDHSALPPESHRLLGPCAPGCDVAWVTKADVPARSLSLTGLEGSAAGVIGDKIYVGHGNAQATDLPDLRIYDIATDSWSFGPDSRFPRSEGVGAAVGTKLYDIGGRGLPAMEEYDTVTSTWTFKSPLSVGRKGMAAGVLGGLIHVVGGAQAGQGPHTGTPLALHEVYDPATDSWSTAASLPTPLSDIYAATVINNKLYIFGGFDGTATVATTWIYDPGTNFWSSGAPMPTARSNAVAGVLCNRAFVIGGISNLFSPVLQIVEVYDPATDSWCAGPIKPTYIAEGAASGISTARAIHAIGSGHTGVSRNFHEALELQESCLVANLTSIQRLQGVKASPGASFSWLPDASAPGYHLNTVTAKTAIGDPPSKLPPTGGATGQCDVTAPACTDGDAIADGTLLYYQAFSACGPSGVDEGPF